MANEAVAASSAVAVHALASCSRASVSHLTFSVIMGEKSLVEEASLLRQLATSSSASLLSFFT